MKLVLKHILVCTSLFIAQNTSAQQLAMQALKNIFSEKDTSIVFEDKIEISSYHYTCNSTFVEAIIFRPVQDGKFPAILFIPGFGKTARDYIPYVLKFCKEGFACIAISQPGFGRSQGAPDYVGPYTIKVLKKGFLKFQKEKFVDSNRMGIYGYSRGAMAASLLVLELDNVQAAIFGAGIYDFEKAYNETKLENIRKNMKVETGMTEKAISLRSSILRMDKLNCQVLILHGEKDKNVPVSQAYLLKNRLIELGKEFEIEIFPDYGHSLGRDVFDVELDFFKRKL